MTIKAADLPVPLRTSLLNKVRDQMGRANYKSMAFEQKKRETGENE